MLQGNAHKALPTSQEGDFLARLHEAALLHSPRDEHHRATFRQLLVHDLPDPRFQLLCTWSTLPTEVAGAAASGLLAAGMMSCMIGSMHGSMHLAAAKVDCSRAHVIPLPDYRPLQTCNDPSNGNAAFPEMQQPSNSNSSRSGGHLAQMYSSKAYTVCKRWNCCLPAGWQAWCLSTTTNGVPEAPKSPAHKCTMTT